MLPVFTDLGATQVLNAYGHVTLQLEPAEGRAGWQLQIEQLRGVKKWMVT
jgi:hypothetical protein